MESKSYHTTNTRKKRSDVGKGLLTCNPLFPDPAF